MYASLPMPGSFSERGGDNPVGRASRNVLSVQEFFGSNYHRGISRWRYFLLSPLISPFFGMTATVLTQKGSVLNTYLYAFFHRPHCLGLRKAWWFPTPPLFFLVGTIKCNFAYPSAAECCPLLPASLSH